MTEDKWKVCALCRYLETVDNGLEIDEVLDTEYTLFHCGRLNVFRHEEYLMAPVTSSVEDTRHDVCPYWEPWSNDCVKSEERFLGLPEAENLIAMEDSELTNLFDNVFGDTQENSATSQNIQSSLDTEDTQKQIEETGGANEL